MGKRRTRKEKEKAQLKLANLVAIQPSVFNEVPKPVTPFSFVSKVPGQNVRQESTINSEIPAIKKDLIKTSIVIVLALASELGVYWILRQGFTPWRI